MFADAPLTDIVS